MGCVKASTLRNGHKFKVLVLSLKGGAAERSLWQMKYFNKAYLFKIWNGVEMRRKINVETSEFVSCGSSP